MRWIITSSVCGIVLLSIVGGLFWFVNSTWQELHTNNISKGDTGSSRSEDWQFAVIGDTEDMHEITQRMLERMKTEAIEFVVHVGDVSSDGTPEHLAIVREAFAALPFPTYYVVGNNDLTYDETTQTRTTRDFEEVMQQEASMSIVHRNAHIVILDNAYRRVGFAPASIDWLKECLDQQQSDHTFLFYHRPLHLPLEEFFGDDETPNSRNNNEKFLNLIANYTIDMIFNGHIHTYIPYTLRGIPTYVSGGGGAYPQELLGGESNAYFHYLIVHVPYDATEDPWIEVRKM